VVAAPVGRSYWEELQQRPGMTWFDNFFHDCCGVRVKGALRADGTVRQRRFLGQCGSDDETLHHGLVIGARGRLPAAALVGSGTLRRFLIALDSWPDRGCGEPHRGPRNPGGDGSHRTVPM
jgi:hypothetical protein